MVASYVRVMARRACSADRQEFAGDDAYGSSRNYRNNGTTIDPAVHGAVYTDNGAFVPQIVLVRRIDIGKINTTCRRLRARTRLRPRITEQCPCVARTCLRSGRDTFQYTTRQSRVLDYYYCCPSSAGRQRPSAFSAYR